MIAGASFSNRMKELLRLGARVRIKRDPEFGIGPWPDEPTGTVIASPDGKPFTHIETRRGPGRTVWIQFDEPQFDPDGDGPYVASEVLDRYVEILEE